MIATTTVDLANLVEQNRFSRQLYYALHSFEIVIPLLRARRNSIPSLVHNRLKSLEKRFSSRLKWTMTRWRSWWPTRGRGMILSSTASLRNRHQQRQRPHSPE
ncbi:DhaR [Klebsiella pneumoniae]|uniref:DhaR n=1 Tax=Klebsiella pneumoniae TaxID=573 RepID=A0A377XFT6_KLEPN|nr:DhaR [Klebsiella pneumoniae]